MNGFTHNMLLVLYLVFVTCNGLNIRNVSDNKQVMKRDAKAQEFYPDWVPFKNKHGEELGEFVQVQSKAKAKKKRLALPVNFVLRAVDEPQADYYEKDLGGEDNYDNKDWSDANRQADTTDVSKSDNHTDISDIDGVVSIITKSNPITEALKKPRKPKVEVTSTGNDDVEIEIVNAKQKESSERDESKERERKEESSKENKKDEEDSDYEESSSSTEKSKPELTEEQKENEAKKARILNSVDELKERHAQEQRFLSEKLKEEEIYKEELERDKVQPSERVDKYGHPVPKHRTADYDDYVDKDTSVEDKYKIKPLRKPRTSTIQPRRSTKRKAKKEKKNKHVESGKLSVFKNPRAYTVLDEESAEKRTVTTQRPEYGKRISSRRPDLTGRYSSRYTTPSSINSDETERISLVPETKDGDFAKKRKNKRKRKNKSTTPPTDSYVAESVPDKTAKDLITAMDVTAVDKSVVDIAGAGTTSVGTATGADSAPSAAESGPSAAASAPSDAVSASSDHKAAGKPKNYHQEKGVDRDHHSEHEEVHEEHGKKAYEGVHKDTKTEKGQHDKEDHLGKYNDHGGIDEHHHDEKNHYGAHHHEEHGKKHAKYEESGKHSKGHNTKGSHDIHKKEEYEKKVEFFEEEGDSSEEEKHGGHNHEHEHSSGGHFKKGNLDANYHGHSKGDSGHFDKGGHEHLHKGHKASGGHDDHGKHGGDHYSQGGKQSGKKWIYHHGHPAKSANLVIIDRRADRFQHGPQYFG